MENGLPALRSLAFDDIAVPDFADVVIVTVPEAAGPISTDPAEWARRVFSISTAPAWVRAIFGLRQALVGFIGIRKGDLATFQVQKVHGSEALLSANDRHLDFRCGVGIDATARLLRVTTVVRLHGWRGRLYFVPVSILHGPITRSMATRAARASS